MSAYPQSGVRFVFLALLLCALFALGGCSGKIKKNRLMEVTAYCDCGQCCAWQRGSARWLRLDFWNRYVTKGSRRGQTYTGRTADGSWPKEPIPGLFSQDSLDNPWMIPFRTVFPWLWIHRDGTIAADTDFYPFGTRMMIPGYGWGVVADRGSAIKGPARLDLYFDSHQEALNWGRRKVAVEVELP